LQVQEDRVEHRQTNIGAGRGPGGWHDYYQVLKMVTQQNRPAAVQ